MMMSDTCNKQTNLVWARRLFVLTSLLVGLTHADPVVTTNTIEPSSAPASSVPVPVPVPVPVEIIEQYSDEVIERDTQTVGSPSVSALAVQTPSTSMPAKIYKVDDEISAATDTDVSDSRTVINAQEVEKQRTAIKHQRVHIYSSESVTPKPRLAIQGPAQLRIIDGKPLPITFYAYSNYSLFIDSWTLKIYRASDSARQDPVFESTTKNMIANPVTWDGTVQRGSALKGEERLFYELEVTGKQGGRDVTRLQRLFVNSNAQLDPRNQLDAVVIANEIEHPYLALSQRDDTASRGIAVNGSLVTVHGANLPAYMTLSVAGLPVQANQQGTLHVEIHQAVGEYSLPVTIQGKSKTLKGNVSDRYFFLAALADVTAGKGRVRGADAQVEEISQNDYFDNDIYVDGRLAFYLKGKIKGKYLLTAQMDTREGKFSEIFENLDQRDDRDSLLERIDPDRYYPVYGDGSSIEDDVDTQGKFYVRVDWNQSQVLWGNFRTNISGTQLGEYNRTLYGGKIDYRSVKKTKFNDHKVQLLGFASKPTSAAARDEFLGTGGSLYYLKHQDVVLGSEQLWIETRDRLTDQVLSRRVLVKGVDYQFNAAQGRIILTEPLLNIARDDTLVDNQVLDGDAHRLIAAYEYELDDFLDDSHLNAGGRAKVWLGNYLGIGVTSVKEEEGNTDYEKQAADVTVRMGNNSYLNAEYASSRNARLVDFNNSITGGLNQTNISQSQGAKGDAYRVDLHVDYQDFSDIQGGFNAWTLDQEAGFDSFIRSGERYIQHGVEGYWQATEELGFRASYVLDDRAQKQHRGRVRADYKLNNRLTVSGEYQRETEGSVDRKDDIAVQLSAQLNDAIRVYAKGQGRFNKRGRYNDEEGDYSYTLGAENRISSKLRFHVEGTDGDLGTGARVGATYTPRAGHDFYVNADVLEQGNGDIERGITLGQRSDVTSKLSVYQEYQFDRVVPRQRGDEDSFDRVWGFRYQLNEGWSIGGSYELSDIEGNNVNDVRRKAGSVRVDYRDSDTQLGVRTEVRKDDIDDGSNATNETQYLFAGRYRQVLNDEFTFLGRFDWSLTEQEDKSTLARFTDAQLGLAYRPVANDRLNLLSLYRYLYNLNPESQLPVQTDEESHIASIDWVYELDEHWELGGKLAYKESRIRLDRDQGDWVRSGVGLGALRMRYHLIKQWDILGEYRRREVLEDGGSLDGFLVDIGYHIGDHLRLSVGYNFSDFSDDIADEDYDRKGWFVNLIGKY